VILDNFSIYLSVVAVNIGVLEGRLDQKVGCFDWNPNEEIWVVQYSKGLL
jgi:hypothetical protein